MAVNLTKGQKIDLNKADGSALAQVYLGAGWDVAAKKSSGGFLSGLFGGGNAGQNIDLDVSAIMFDAGQHIADVVYFGQLKSRDGSIQHSGDNLTGEGDGDDEIVYINLPQVPSNIENIVLTISSFRGQTFENVENAFCRLVDQNTNQEIARYNLSSKGNYTALIIAKLYRHNGAWKMAALGEPCQGKTFDQMLPSIKPFL